jgi:uncharacterized Zn finger protein
MGYYDHYGWKPYVSAAERRRTAEREMQKLRKQGHPASPVKIEGREIARTFWGKAWCDNLEHYSDYANRLPRGRTYVRNGSVVDLQVAPGEVSALVSGSMIYRVTVKVSAIPKARWTSICTDCGGAIDSLVELLQGRFSRGVMDRICREKSGLFPAPAEIHFTCSCPDWASMCKHVAAVLYGIGARLDEQPELIFTLRKVDGNDLIAKAGRGLPLSKKGPGAEKILANDDLSKLFGLDLGTGAAERQTHASPAHRKAATTRRTTKPRAKPQPRPAPAKSKRRQTTVKRGPKPRAKKRRSTRR